MGGVCEEAGLLKIYAVRHQCLSSRWVIDSITPAYPLLLSGLLNLIPLIGKASPSLYGNLLLKDPQSLTSTQTLTPLSGGDRGSARHGTLVRV